MPPKKLVSMRAAKSKAKKRAGASKKIGNTESREETSIKFDATLTNSATTIPATCLSDVPENKNNHLLGATTVDASRDTSEAGSSVHSPTALTQAGAISKGEATLHTVTTAELSNETLEVSPRNPTLARGQQIGEITGSDSNVGLGGSLLPTNPPNIPACVQAEVDRIGYFDPDYPAPLNARDPIRISNREYIYRDVFAFSERLRAITSTWKLDQLQTILPKCFRNSASTWYHDELGDHERDVLLSAESDFETWHGALTARFGAYGQKLAQSSVSTTELVDQNKSKKLNRKKSTRWNRRQGEELNEWQNRIGQGNV